MYYTFICKKSHKILIIIQIYIYFIYCHREHSPFRQHISKVYDEKEPSTSTDIMGANLKELKTPTFTLEEKDCKLFVIFVQKKVSGQIKAQLNKNKNEFVVVFFFFFTQRKRCRLLCVGVCCCFVATLTFIEIQATSQSNTTILSLRPFSVFLNLNWGPPVLFIFFILSPKIYF